MPYIVSSAGPTGMWYFIAECHRAGDAYEANGRINATRFQDEDIAAAVAKHLRGWQVESVEA